jgi:phospholipid/cholesterol/gamma-HCH transport system ATP-binding protein
MAGENKPCIEVKNLRKSFGQQQVLKGVNLEVACAETLAVLGRSGIGKSVLLKLLIGIEQPDSGSVRINGTEMVHLGERQLNEVRKQMGFLFQHAALYDSLSVGENVAFPLLRHTRLPSAERMQKVRELLSSVGLENTSAKMPSELSGGMQKRVGLARALALDPSILLFDEPTAGLDPISAAEIGTLIMDLNKKRRITSIVVTHDVTGARTFSDRMVLLNDGTIVAEGTFDELQEDKDPFVRRFLGDGRGQAVAARERRELCPEL